MPKDKSRLSLRKARKMQMDLKSNHHYVYKNYLNGWAVDGAKKGVFYLTKKRSIARDSAAGLCVEKNFYRFSPILEEDLPIFDKFISTFGEHHQESCRKMIGEFYRLSRVHHFLSGIEQTSKVKDLINFIEKNTLEDQHCRVENAAKSILERLWAGDFNALSSSDDCAAFAYFLGCQALRNKGPKVESIKLFSETKHEDYKTVEMLNVFWARYWNIIVSMLSQNMGANIFGSLLRGKFEFLVNGTDLPFITSDRPVNNIHPDEIGKKAAPDFMDLYYPLSPQLAFHLPESFSGCRVVRDLSREEVEALNKLVASASFGTIVSTTKVSIERYKKAVPVQH